MNNKVIFTSAILSIGLFSTPSPVWAQIEAVSYTAPVQTRAPGYVLKLANFNAEGDLQSVLEIESFPDQQDCQLKLTATIDQIMHHTTRSLGENVLTDATGDLAEFNCSPIGATPRFHTKQQIMQLLLKSQDRADHESDRRQSKALMDDLNE
jgi:hypothetical protein